LYLKEWVLEMNLIDVTLRDGGHAIKWDWPLKFAQEYYQAVSKIDEINYIEVGYWKQTKKSNNPHYNLNLDYINELVGDSKKRNVGIMVDYHYCSHNIRDYPSIEQQDNVGLIRMCARKQDYNDALKFLLEIKNKSGLLTSLNVFNISNYTDAEILEASRFLKNYDLDYVTFADTHGTLDLQDKFEVFREAVNILNDSGIKAGMHLHDHSGKAYFNYRLLRKIGFESTDASSNGMGKGVGNLRMEHVLNKENLAVVAEIVNENRKILTMKEIPHALVTARYSIVDYYGYNAEKLNISLKDFEAFCKTVAGVDKDVYNHSLLLKYFDKPSNLFY